MNKLVPTLLTADCLTAILSRSLKRELPGLDTFKGHVVHSEGFTNGARNAGHRIRVTAQ